MSEKPRVTIEKTDDGGFVLDVYKPRRNKEGQIDYDRSSSKHVAASLREAVRKAQTVLGGRGRKGR